MIILYQFLYTKRVEIGYLTSHKLLKYIQLNRL